MVYLSPYLIVKDIEKSKEFYSALFEMSPESYAPNRFLRYVLNNTNLALYNPKYDHELLLSGKDLSNNFNDEYIKSLNNHVKYGNNIVLNITVEDLLEEYERVKSLAIGEFSELLYINVSSPYWCFWLTDPDGNCIEITGSYKPKEE